MNKELQIISLLQHCQDAYAQGQFYKLSADDANLLDEVGYWEGTEMTDIMYDYIYYKYRNTYPTNQFFYEVGKSDAGYGEEVDLSMWPAGSMEEIKEGDLNKWKIKAPYLISAKLDGCSLVLFYKNGYLDKASTRGDGLKGFDVTRHVCNIKSIPFQFPDGQRDDVIIRGELIISKDDWPKCKAELEEQFGKSFANARNTVAGFLNSKTTNQVIMKYATFLAYAINNDHDEEQKFIDLQEYGFLVPTHHVYNYDEFDENVLQNKIKAIKETYTYECDGVILTLVNNQRLPGYETNTLNPRCSRKYKVGMADDAKETTVLKVRWQISKDGLLKPVLEIAPIVLDGATVSNVTANNYSTVKSLGLGPGAIIKVKRSGMVIPYLEEVVESSDITSEPDVPFILSDTGVEAIYAGDSVNVLFDINLQKLVFACKQLDIDQAADGNLRKIADDYYQVTDQYMSFLDLVGMNEDSIVSIIGKNGHKLYKSLHERIKNISEPELFDALGTFGRGIGKTKLQKIFDAYGCLCPSKEHILALEGFSDITAQQIIDHKLDYLQTQDLIMNLDAVKLVEKIQPQLKSAKYADYHVCFTGVRSDELCRNITENGGIATENWNKSVNLLVAKDPNSSSGKAKKARERGIRIISLEEAKEIFVD